MNASQKMHTAQHYGPQLRNYQASLQIKTKKKYNFNLFVALLSQNSCPKKFEKHTTKNFWLNNQPWHLYTEWSGFLSHNRDTFSISSFLLHGGSHSFLCTLAGKQNQKKNQQQ